MPTGTGPLVLKTREPFTIRYKGTLFFPFSSYTGQSSPRKPNHPRFTLFRLTREPQVANRKSQIANRKSALPNGGVLPNGEVPKRILPK